MGMWQGISQGLDAVEQRKLNQAELDIRKKSEERLEKQFNQEMTDRRLKQIIDLGGFVSSSRSGKASKDARADAEAVVTFKNRMQAALKNVSIEDQQRLQEYTNQLTTSPEKTAEVLGAWNQLNESGSNIQITEIPEIFQIISFTAGDTEQTRLTLEELYNIDLTDDEVYKNLLQAAASSNRSSVVVDYNPASTSVRKPEDLRAQYQYILPIVIGAAEDAQSQTDRPDAQEITAALNDVKSSNEAVRARAQSYLFRKFFSLERAQELESSGNNYFRGLTDNPLVAARLVSKEPVVNSSPAVGAIPGATVLTQEMIDSNPSLKNIGAEPGDQFLQTQEGGKLYGPDGNPKQ